MIMFTYICIFSIAFLGRSLSAEKVAINFDLQRGEPLTTANEYKAQIKLALDSVHLVRNNLDGSRFPNLESPIQLDVNQYKIWHNKGGYRDELYYTTPKRVFTSPLSSIGYSILVEQGAVLNSGFYPSRVIYNPTVYNAEKEKLFVTESETFAKFNEQLLSSVFKNGQGQSALEVIGQLEKKLADDKAQREKKEQDRLDEQKRLHESGLKAIEDGTVAIYKLEKGDKLASGNYAIKMVLENQNANTAKFPSVVQPNSDTFHTDNFDDILWFVAESPGREDLNDLKSTYYVLSKGLANVQSGFYSLNKEMTNYLRDLYAEPLFSVTLVS